MLRKHTNLAQSAEHAHNDACPFIPVSASERACRGKKTDPRPTDTNHEGKKSGQDKGSREKDLESGRAQLDCCIRAQC